MWIFTSMPAMRASLMDQRIRSSSKSGYGPGDEPGTPGGCPRGAAAWWTA